MGYAYGTSRKALRPTTPDQEQPKPKLAPVVQANPKPKLAPKPERLLMPCGTNAAYNRHRKRYEKPCAACMKARREYVAEQRKSATRRRAEAKCGTYAGTIRHYRNREPACQPCRDANNVYQRGRRATKKAAHDLAMAYDAAIQAHPDNATEGPARRKELVREIELASIHKHSLTGTPLEDAA